MMNFFDFFHSAVCSDESFTLNQKRLNLIGQMIYLVLQAFSSFYDTRHVRIENVLLLRPGPIPSQSLH